MIPSLNNDLLKRKHKYNTVTLNFVVLLFMWQDLLKPIREAFTKNEA